ncbi:MAG: hypothetical protein P857_3 [Candidatus Xenolissoclinum pacificiensis L6]|uniref:Uncharacterized protein n=1 Tax=Candidatus Xenolissoclinum pacificiensis L6 TaxID=1401685 RepID=W2UZG8_9RICK|nr:MAG: hypothetical protein P857_3 [Candidatus Xenolissoclinum pacificiensis L6]
MYTYTDNLYSSDYDDEVAPIGSSYRPMLKPPVPEDTVLGVSEIMRYQVTDPTKTRSRRIILQGVYEKFIEEEFPIFVPQLKAQAWQTTRTGQVVLGFKTVDTSVAVFNLGSKTWLYFSGEVASNVEYIIHRNEKMRSFNVVESTNQHLIMNVPSNKVSNVKVLKNGNILFLTFDEVPSIKPAHISTHNSYVKIVPYNLPISKAQQKEIILNDDGYIHNVTLLLVDQERLRSDKYQFLYFDLLESRMGLAFIKKDESLSIEQYVDKILVRHPAIIMQDDRLTQGPVFLHEKWNMEEYGASYNANVTMLNTQMYEALDSTLPEEIIKVNLRAVKFYVANGMNEQAMYIISRTLNRYISAMSDMEFQIVYAMTLFANRKYQDAYYILHNIDIEEMTQPQQLEILLLEFLIKEKLGFEYNIDLEQYDFATIDQFVYGKDILLLLFKTAIVQQDFNYAYSLYNHLMIQDELTLRKKHTILYDFAILLYKLGNQERALDILEYLSSKVGDPINRSKALITIFAKYPDMYYTYEERYNLRIQQLPFIWKNHGTIEVNALRALMFHYIYVDQPLKVLDTIQKILDISEDETTNKLVLKDVLINLFRRIMISDSIDEVSKIKTYLKYKSLVLEIVRDPQVLNIIQGLLINVGLMDDVILLNNVLAQINISSPAIEDTALKIVQLHIGNKEFDKAIDILNDYSESIREIEMDYHMLLIDFHKAEYTQVLEKIDTWITNEKFRVLKYRTILALADTDLIIENFEPILQYRENPESDLSTLEEEMIYFLGISYGQKNNVARLNALYSAYIDKIQNERIRDNMTRIVNVMNQYVNDDQYITNLNRLLIDNDMYI